MRKKRFLKKSMAAAGTAVFLLSALLAGCSSSTTATSSQTSEMTSAQTDESDSGSDTDTSSDATINMGITTAWDSLMPYNSSSNSMYAKLIYDLLYDKLAYTGEAGTTVEPRAATSWESTDDGYGIVFYLDENARWHDGEPVTAADWVYTVELTTDPDLPATSRPFVDLEGTDDSGVAIEGAALGVEALDDYTLKFTLKAPMTPEDFLILNNRQICVLPKHLLEDTVPSDIMSMDLWTSPIGSGPCIFASEIVGNQLVLTSNQDYHLGAPDWGTLVISVISSANTLSSQIAGQLDVYFFNSLTTDDKELAEMSGLSTIESGTASSFVEMMLNNQSISDSRIRQAIMYALDRQVLADQSTQGLGEASASSLLKESDYYNTELSTERDLDKAKELLEEAGYDGTVYTMAINSTRDALASLIQQQLAEAGVQIEILTVDTATMFTGMTDGTYDMGISGHTATAYPLYFASNLSNVNSTYFNITDPTYNEYYNEISACMDEEEKTQLLMEYQEYIYEECPFIPLYHSRSYFPVSATVDGIDYGAAPMCNLNVWEWSKKE